MRQRDYILIAHTIRDASAAPGYAKHNKFVAVALADAFAREKPGFDRQLFLINCGVVCDEQQKSGNR